MRTLLAKVRHALPAVRPTKSADQCPHPAFIQHSCCNKSVQLMPSAVTTLRRRVKALHRNLRGASMAAHALASTDHPLLAHIIPIRRCNLACTYCNEFDDFSKRSEERRVGKEC